MARRSEHTQEELKVMAISAGLELIRKEGFSNFSARKVAKKMGYTVGTIYHLFGNYNDFILHLNAHTLDEWFEYMQQTLAKDEGKKPLHTMACAYINYSRSHYEQWLTLFEHHMKGDIPEWYQPKFIRFFDLVEKLLLPIVGNNRKKAKQAAHVLWASIHGICVLSLSEKLKLVEAESTEVLALSFIDNYLRGLR